MFPHRRIHKATWVSPEHRTENQINHICIGRKFRRSMQDVRVQRGANAASDHHLVLARMKMKLNKREVKRSTRMQYNVDFLKDRVTTETFRLAVRNKYEALQDILDEGNMDIDTQWQQIKEMWTSTCSELLGKKKYQQKDWISASTVNKVQVREEKKGAVNNSRTRAAKAAAQEEYTEANRAVKNSVKVLNRVILDRLKTGVDAKLRDHQAGFRKDRSCTDQIATLRIIVEQSMEWDSSLYINCVDYEKAFDSLDRDTLWKLLQHYGIPENFLSLIRNSYEDMACRVVHAGQLTDSFMVKTGVRQGCLLSPFLFLLALDWIMKK